MNVREFIQVEFSDLYEGESRAGQLCPSCKGGGSGEHTLSVSMRDGRVLFVCHRDSCGLRGSTAGEWRGQQRTTPVQVRGAVGRQLVRESSSLPPEISERLRIAYGITERHSSRAGLGWVDDRLSIPLRDVQGNVVGVNLRSLDGAQPKSKLHSESGAMSWFINHNSPDVIIVEDQLSAIRASDYLTSVALLGTNINEERISEIKRVARGSVYLALDADAWSRAVKYAVQFRSRLPLRLLRLAKDIKNMNEVELKEWVNENRIGL